VTGAALVAQCTPDLAAEREHLAAMLPPGTLGASTGAGAPGRFSSTDSCAVLSWASSGLMDLTGLAGGPPLAPAAPVLARAGVIASAITDVSAAVGQRVQLDLRSVLTGRAALQGCHRSGTRSANGTCRLLRAADDWLAVNLARRADTEAVPALLSRQFDGDPWSALAADAPAWPAAGLAGRAQLLGIPAAALGSVTPDPVRFRQAGTSGIAPRLVLDLSALWAGPLCTSILRQAGWRTLTVEDPRRPDGARASSPRFYAGLHEGGRTVQLDFSTTAGQGELKRLAGQAGVVVESSRPRALRRLGLDAAQWLAAVPGRVWVSVTGYGRADPAQRVAFGDDAAVAGGLVAWSADLAPVFCGDAIADPLTGLLAALAALAALRADGGMLVGVSLAGVCADLARPGTGPAHAHEIVAGEHGWTVSHGHASQQVLPP
jgi:crotonobetainyl-CoA:carnitine CoA-transferase CaiB-like acyl-CoA transferase